MMLHGQKKHAVNAGVKSGVDFYHVHSYHCKPKDSSVILSRTIYGEELVTAVARANVCAVQFHPEKSQPAGIKLISNFLDWCEEDA